MARRLCGEDAYPAALLAVAGHGVADEARPVPAETLADDSRASLLTATRSVLGQLGAAADPGRPPVTIEGSRRGANPAGLLAVATRAFPAEPLADESRVARLTAAKAHRVLGQLRAAVGSGQLPVTIEEGRRGAQTLR